MLHAYGLEIPRTLEEICDPRRVALLVYDMQVGILRQIKNGPEITARVQRVVDAARNAGVRVIFSRYMSVPKELMGVFQLRMAMAWQRVETADEVRPRFLRDSPGFQLIPELSPQSGELVVDRITMSAFEGTPLDLVLRDCGINAFVIVGVAMEVGIEPTVRHAADLGYIPVIVRDACGAGKRGGSAALHRLCRVHGRCSVHRGGDDLCSVEREGERSGSPSYGRARAGGGALGRQSTSR